MEFHQRPNGNCIVHSRNTFGSIRATIKMQAKDGKWFEVTQKDVHEQQRKTLKRLVKSLNIITRMFWLIGIDMRLQTTADITKPANRPTCIGHTLIIVHLLIGIPLIALCLANVFEILRAGVLMELDLGESAINIQSMTNLFTAIVTYGTIIFRSQRILHLMATLLEDMTANLRPQDVVKVCRRINISSIVLCFIIGVYFVALCKVSLVDQVELSAATAAVEKYTNMSWFTWMSMDFKKPAYIIGECFNGFFLNVMGFITNALFCTILVLLTIQLDYLVFIPKASENEEILTTHDRLKAFMTRHSEICTFFEKTNQEFGLMLFMWVSSKVIGITFLLRAMALDKTTSTSLLFSLHVVIFLIICSFSIAANDKLINSLQHVGIVEKEDNDWHKQEENFEVKTNFQLYCTRLMISTPKICAWGFFDIDKPFVVAVFGTVLTYVLLLYDKGT